MSSLSLCNTSGIPLRDDGRPRVGDSRSDEADVTKKYEEEVDDEGFTTVRTKKTKREMIKRSKVVTWKDIESQKCKSVSRAILLKQSS
jgi:hypothetical protein